MDLPEQLGLTTRYFDLPKLRMHAAVAGSSSGDLVILLHGFPQFWFSWRHQMKALADAGYYVVAPDQRGYNLTDKTPPFDVFTLTDDIVELIKACGREHCYLVGHDWGAAVAWAVARFYPEHVKKLAILNVPHPVPMARALRGGNLKQLLMSWYIFFFQVPFLPEAMLSSNSFASLRGAMKRGTRAGTFTRNEFTHYIEAWSQKDSLSAMIGWYRALFRSGAAGAHRKMSPRIKTPTLILWGEKDFALSVELAEESLKWCDEAKLIRFPASHWLQEELADEISQKLLEYFR